MLAGPSPYSMLKTSQCHLNSNFHVISARGITVVSGGARAGLAEEEEEECSICLDPLMSGDCMELKPCKHRFHLSCIQVNSGLLSSVTSSVRSLMVFAGLAQQ